MSMICACVCVMQHVSVQFINDHELVEKGEPEEVKNGLGSKKSRFRWTIFSIR